jgi:hypothetical protein
LGVHPLKVSSARRRARQAALDALLAEGKVIELTKEYFANDPSGSVEQLIHAEAVRLDAYLRSVPELLSRSGKKLRSLAELVRMAEKLGIPCPKD